MSVGVGVGAKPACREPPASRLRRPLPLPWRDAAGQALCDALQIAGLGNGWSHFLCHATLSTISLHEWKEGRKAEGGFGSGAWSQRRRGELRG